MKYLRLLMRDIYLPHAIVDQRFAQLSVDLEDTTDHISLDDAVVQFDVDVDGETMKYMFLRDMARALIKGDLDLESAFEVALLDELLRVMTDNVDFRTFHDIFEYFDGIALIGEQFAAHYKTMTAARQEEVDVTALDQYLLSMRLSQGVSEPLIIQSGDSAMLQPDLVRALSDQIDITLGNNVRFAPSLRASMRESQEVNIEDQFKSQSGLMKQLNDYYGLSTDERIEQQFSLATGLNDTLSVDSEGELINQRISLAPGLKDALDISAGEQMNQRNSLTPGLKDSMQVAFSRYVSPTYLPHPKDGYGRDRKEAKVVQLDSSLDDSFVLNGKEQVLYALGDVSETGWPIGKFKIGTNTLKGVNP
jgi:hypothetical protein